MKPYLNFLFGHFAEGVCKNVLEVGRRNERRHRDVHENDKVFLSSEAETFLKL
jgi:hypothetical protein